LSRIRILPENLANQIAAGEVVERPASVVKELLENAIDAGASRIDLQVEGDGTRLIRVVDDGAGMDEDDALLCLERHATSKIASLSELGAIRTLGFRGEAVPSIASVSRMRITTRPAGRDLGTQVDIRFGRMVKVHEMGTSAGAIFEVSDLFGNVPARRKFLKATRTELAHIEEVVKNYALARPELGISLQVDGRELIRLPAGSDSLQGRVMRLFGRGAGSLVEVGGGKGAESGAGIAVFGFLLPPDSATAARLRIFVNGRAVQDRAIAHAVAEGLQNYLMKGRGPGGALFVVMPAAEVDVNVHPAKSEVRFAKPAQVHQAVLDAVQAAMARHQQVLRQEIFRLPERRESVAGEAPAALSPPLSPPSSPVSREPLPFYRAATAGPAPAASPLTAKCEEDPLLPDVFLPSAGSRPQPEAGEGNSPQPGSLRYLGQVLDTYLLCATDDGLLVVDQHAAHERLLFEKLKKQFSAKQIARQTLLFPKVVECGPEELQILRQHAEEIAALGLAIEDFGGASRVIKAVPAVLGRFPVEEVLAGVMARFSEPGSGKGGVRAEEVLSDMACKAAIRAGQSLNATEAEALLGEMQRAAVFSHCPHGRPVARSFSEPELKKWFYRS